MGTNKSILGSKVRSGGEGGILITGSTRVPFADFLNLEHQLDARLPGTRKNYEQ
jgi:hypothetical protein